MIGKNNYLLATAIAMFLAGGCTVIQFDNGYQPNKGAATITQWHHSFAFETIEGSDPIDPATACGSEEWQSVKSEHAYSGVITATLLWNPIGASALGSGLWTPRSIQIRCGN